MSPAHPPAASHPAQALFGAAVLQAAADGSVLMGKLIAAARLGLQTQEAEARDLRERDALAEAAQTLRQHERTLCKSYPSALVKAFSVAEGRSNGALTGTSGVHFDQLELMDEQQVQSAVTLARVRQTATQSAGVALAELHGLVSSVLGLPQVQVESNVLRPDSYVQALQAAVEKTLVRPEIQAQWYGAMAHALGQELRILYAGLIAQLRQAGVVPIQGPGLLDTAPFAAAAASAKTPAATQSGQKDPALLTLDKLRKLLSGELASTQTGNRVQQFAAQFSQNFEADQSKDEEGNNGFESTVPAALEALTEMKQVDQVVRNLEQRRTAAPALGSGAQDSVEAQRQALRRRAKDVAQALSLEVVTLMVDNMAQDARLLDPVRQVIRALEPSLLRLALVDPRFFTDKQHPARALLQAVTHQSLAFESDQAAGFDTFMLGLERTLEPLSRLEATSAEVFSDKLTALKNTWADSTRGSLQVREATVEVLRHAEARNLLAEKIATSIEALPDSTKVPAAVIDFLCGPWAQVVAQARIKHGAGSAQAEKFEALIAAMLWSAHPDLARANPAKLTRLVPRLLATLREGLETIQYPGTQASQFFEVLMAIHQQVFRPAAPAASGGPAMPAAHERARPVEDGNPWIAPEEAAASNFVSLEGDSLPPPVDPAPLLPDFVHTQPEPASNTVDMPLGSWVELWHNGQWVRTQLTWASPHQTLYLFTGVFGATQSLSRRLRDKLLASGKLRLLSGHAFVDGALDAVAQTAVRNSMDNSL